MESDLRQQLQLALGDAYVVERELGGGGMSRVFLATEVGLDRPVVLKVLPPEMAATVSIERFRREIRLAASLQHPHIVPLHSAGQAGDLLYYSMPLVEGESLRAKLDREDALPVNTAVRILRDVADALAYAHAHGVVHRDIKPDNILLSGSHAVVTDFGVAKAMSAAASGHSSLTSMGVALGTPAYMAPEQAAADPHVDQRADIYALGAVGYEMLCGRPPFVGMTAQQVLAAHVTQTPEPCASHRATVPPALNALIMRCLEKRPADRPQQAEEIVAELEAMATPSSGTQPTGASLATSITQPRRAHRSRRTVLLGAGTLVAAGVLYAALRLLGIVGPMHTLIAAGVMSEQQRILLSDFENRAADTTLGPTLTEAFRVDLAQSRAVQLEPPTAVAEALTRMQRPARTALTPALAREVAERGGLKAVVTGEIDPVGAGYVLSASVVGASDGRVLTAVRETADNAGALIPALDRLSRALRAEIGESLKTIRADEPLADVTTASMDALRKYTAAVRLADAGDDEGALPLLQAATQADTSFATAYRKLAAVLVNTGGSSEAIFDASTRAYTHRDRLPELERDHADGFYFGNVTFDIPKEVAAYQAALALRPDDDVALIDLGLALERLGQFGAAESLYTSEISLDPAELNGYVDLADAQANEGRFAAADSTLARSRRTIPGNMQGSFFPVFVAAAERHFAAAESLGRAVMPHLPPRAGGRQFTTALLANVSVVRGRLAEATQRAHDAMAIADERGLAGQYLQGAVELGDIETRYRDRPAAALTTISTALARHPLASIPTADRPYADLARLYVSAGRVDEARRMLDEYDRAVPEGTRRGNNQREAALGDVAAADGHVPDAIAHYHAYHSIDGTCVSCGLFELAEMYRRNGNADSALAYYTSAIDAPGLFRTLIDSRTLAASYQRLGELQEKAGNRSAARDAYTHLIDLWADADPELQPIVRDVRARVARLASDK